MAIIEVNQVTKEYRLGQMTSLIKNIKNLFSRLRGKASNRTKCFNAIDGVTMHIDPGEVVGIIGANGAGKSTLLKLISRISVPTKGSINVAGSIAPLIEVSAGLHPEMTGMENIYLNGSILGIPRSEIKTKIDDIVEFSELEEFIHTPIKRYSSGMKVRLGFAIATTLEADILIIDEILAVGDLAFQRKCFDRMEDLIKQKDKTVLIVSHNIRQVRRICSRVIILDRGQILLDGDPQEVCDSFYKLSNKRVYENVKEQQKTKSTIKSSGEAELIRVDILNADGNPVEEVETDTTLRIRVRFKLNSPLKKGELIIGTHTTDFIYLNASSTSMLEEPPEFDAGTHEIECTVPSIPFAPGIYCVRFVIFDKNRRRIFNGETLKMFNVTQDQNESKKVQLRLLNLPSSWIFNGKRYCEH